MKNIHILPTDKPSRLHLESNGLKLSRLQSTLVAQNIYITNSEEIKEGDWYINTFVSEREQKPQTHAEKRQLINHQKDYRFKYCKKIILTTDQDLDGVQAIDDEFLELFVKNPSCEYIKTEKWLDDEAKVFYSRIIPKQERERGITITHVNKQETLEEDFKIWDDLFGILAWKFKPTKGGDMYLDGEKVYEELKSKFKLKRI